MRWSLGRNRTRGLPPLYRPARKSTTDELPGYSERHVMQGWPPIDPATAKLYWAEGDPGMEVGLWGAIGATLGKFLGGLYK